MNKYIKNAYLFLASLRVQKATLEVVLLLTEMVMGIIKHTVWFNLNPPTFLKQI